MIQLLLIAGIGVGVVYGAKKLKDKFGSLNPLNLVKGIREKFSSIRSNAQEKFRNTTERIRNKFAQAGTNIKKGISNAGKNIKNFFANIRRKSRYGLFGGGAALASKRAGS